MVGGFGGATNRQYIMNTQAIRDKFRVKAASYYLSGDNIEEQLALLDEAESTIPNEVSVWEKFEYEPLDNLMEYIDDLTDMLVEAANEVKPTNHSNTINFMYFAYNFPPNWIFKVWRGETVLCNHLLAKMRGYSGNGTENFFKFFMELSDGNKAKLCKWIDANYHNGDVKPSVTNEIDRAQLVLRWDNTSTRDDSTNFTVYHNDEQVAYGRLNNETNWAHVTMTLSEDVDDEYDLEGYLVKAIEQRTIRVV
jgi:hypothetical protein